MFCSQFLNVIIKQHFRFNFSNLSKLRFDVFPLFPHQIKCVDPPGHKKYFEYLSQEVKVYFL